MVRVKTDTHSIQNLISKNTNPDNDVYDGDQISICSDFQRGDEETGVWDKATKRLYIESLLQQFPTGILTFVKDYSSATSYNGPWKTLDGGNRFRTIRDFMLDKFDSQERKFSELETSESERFKNISIPCQWIDLQRDDPSDTIAQMFTRLNTSANPLSQGELLKAHGWKGDIQEIELAKALIKDQWTTAFPSHQEEIIEIRTDWEACFGVPLSETKRCDSLAMIVGYIVSAKEGDFRYFDKRYKTTKDKLVSLETNLMSNEEILSLLTKLKLFLEITSSIFDKSIFGNIKKGIPSQLKIAPVWKRICEGTITTDFKYKMIEFYNELADDETLKEQYKNILNDGSNSETTDGKINGVLEFIENGLWNYV